LRLHVLVIDDDDAVRSSIVRMLSAHGHEATGAADGNQALQLALARTPHVIVVDLHMPDQNGIEVARMLQRHTPLASVPIVALSATSDDIADAMIFRHVLSKPCSSADLLIAVLSAVQTRA
jgi:two-component system, OmpR family, alkaline phosphatase synthesis response regulator PhoP